MTRERPALDDDPMQVRVWCYGGAASLATAGGVTHAVDRHGGQPG